MTPPIFNLSFALAAGAIVAASGLALWWLLRRETATTLLVLAVTTSLSLALRLYHTDDYPRGLNEDEPKVLYAAGRAVQRGTFLAESNISVPILPHALFQGQLIPLLGTGRWAIRAYSLVGGVLTTPAAFAAARAMGMAVAPSMAAGALVAALPWSIFYSRVMTGCELTFFQLLLLTALARLIWQGGGWREAVLGACALAWLLYGYWCTRSMLPMPLLAALLAVGRRRVWCVAILVAALALYAPYVLANRDSTFIRQGVDPTYYAGFGGLLRLGERGLDTLQALLMPGGEDGWLTVRAAAIHPWPVLVLAMVGLLGSARRAGFLAGGFLLGLAPAALAWGAPSTHRMLMAFPFVALSAAAAVDLVRRPFWCRAAAAAAIAVVGLMSVRLYFSADFWPVESQWKFDWQRTELLESLPVAAAPPIVFAPQVGFFRDPRRLFASTDQDLSVDNWLPGASGGLYAFAPESAPLRPLYEQMLGAARLQWFGDAFTASFEARDWSFLRRHGWAYSARCADDARHGQVPTLFQPNLTFADFRCDRDAEHMWRARWRGPAATLRLHAGSAATVETPRGHLSSYEREPYDRYVVDIAVDAGDLLTVRVVTPALVPWVYATLFELTPAGERLPAWDSLEPVSEPEPPSDRAS